MMPDGQAALVRAVTGDATKLAVFSLVDRVLKPLLKTSFNQINGEVSPDGRWILYQSEEGSTVSEVHVRPYPETDAGHWQISTGGGRMPLWSRSGREIFYIARQPDRLMVAAVTPVRRRTVRRRDAGGPLSGGEPLLRRARPHL